MANVTVHPSYLSYFPSPLLSHHIEESRDGLPAARIADIVSASSLTDEEIEPLIELLLEKSNTNSEWEAVSALRYVVRPTCWLLSCKNCRSFKHDWPLSCFP